jgi:hypothetical protein
VRLAGQVAGVHITIGSAPAGCVCVLALFVAASAEQAQL